MDKITQILQQMHEMADEPVRMQEGGTVDNTRLGNVLTPEEYQARNIDYYAPFSVQVQQAPEVDEEEEEEEPIRPDILTPVGQRGEQVANVFGQIPIYGSGEQFGTEDYNSYIENFDKQQKSDLSGKGFDRYLEQAAGIPGAVATVATGLPISALAYGAGQLARKEHRKNAAAIQAVGGASGDMFKFNGQTVSRSPGSKIFTGNLGGLSQADMFRNREIAKGFIPGTMAIGKGFGSLDAARTGGDAPETGLSGVTSIEGAMMDAFGTVHTGQRNESGHMMASATQAQRLREQEFRDAAREANIDISGLKGADFVNAAVAFKQHVDGVMKTDPSYGGFRHKTSNLSQAANNSALDRRRGTAVDFLKEKYGITTAPTTTDDGGAPPPPPPPAAPPTTVTPTEGDPGTRPDDGDDGIQDAREYSISQGFSAGSSGNAGREFGGGQSFGVGSSIGGGFAGARAMGGRVGMQAGGVAQQPQPAGFVGGPPENFTDGQTVADDQPMTVPEGTFVINAAAVEFAGSDDIKKMLSDAYGKMQKKVDKTIGVAKIPTEDEIDVAVSRGEVIVPPEVAKIIGYDRLEKINNRGKKEVSRRQEKAAGGGLLAGKKFADGGEIYEDRIIMEEVRRKMDALLKNLPDDVKVDSRYYGDDYPARRDFHRQLAILNDADPDAFNMRPFASEEKGLINVPQTPTLFNLYAMAEEIAHLEASKNRRPETATVQTLRADEQSLFASIPGTDGDMRTHYGAYEQGGFLYTPSEVASMSDKEKAEIQDIYGVPADKVRNTFSYPDYFELEQDYLEEMRAKSIAFQTVFGKLDKRSSKNVKENTKTGRAIDLAESSYGENFAKYILATASPTLQAAIYHKHPELRERYFDDQGRFKKRNIQPDADFRMAMKFEDEESRKRSLKEFEEADDRNIVVKSLTSPRKSTFVPGYGRIGLAEGGKAPKTLPKRKPKKEFLADVELRADLEEYIRDDKLAKLGWDLYTSGDLKLIGTPLRRGTTGATAGGQYFPKKGEDDYPDYPSGTSKVETAGDAAPMWKALTSKLGRVMDSNAPTAIYFAEAMPAFDADRASVFITLAHELRHAALNHLANEYGAPQQTLSTEERIMDFYDEKARREASEKNPLVNKKFSPASLDVDKTSARQIPKYAKMHKMYEELAQAVLEERGVPTIAPPEEKGFITKFLDNMFRKSPPSKLKKGDGKPVDYESEAMQSANF